jgi:hypothetical protein
MAPALSFQIPTPMDLLPFKILTSMDLLPFQILTQMDQFPFQILTQMDLFPFQIPTMMASQQDLATEVLFDIRTAAAAKKAAAAAAVGHRTASTERVRRPVYQSRVFAVASHCSDTASCKGGQLKERLLEDKFERGGAVLNCAFVTCASYTIIFRFTSIGIE